MKKICLNNLDKFVELTKCWDIIVEIDLWMPFIGSFVIYKSFIPNVIILKEVKQTIMRLFWFEISYVGGRRRK